VTEALNPAGEEFGEDRLQASIAAQRGTTPQAILDVLLTHVREFSAGAPQSDDLTLVVLRYDG
jgi:sigma-B regulation protein RsbU (phosphoserine phosphatase)